MNKNIIKAFFPIALRNIENGKCPTCGKKINIKDFKDSLSLREWKISGLCLKCQNKIFK